MKNPFYCLFYSFKGGVGRTSALMNTARYLAERKKRVLVIDFDLAAPGIDVFDVWQKEMPGFPSYHPTKYEWAKRQGFQSVSNRWEWDASNPQPVPHDTATGELGTGAPLGFVEFALAFQQNHIDKRPAEGEAQALPELSYPNDPSGGTEPSIDWGKTRYLYKLPPRRPSEGDILMMRAGNHDITEALAERRGLEEHYTKQRIALNFEKLKAREEKAKEKKENADNDTVDAEPAFVGYFREQIRNLGPDYVLIDGRPGMDDASLFAMEFLSDCVVLCFNLNPWNFQGIIHAYGRLNDIYRRSIGVKQENTKIHHPNILLVATPIPPQARNSRLYTGQFETIKDRMPGARNCGLGEAGGPIEIPYADILLLRDVLISDISDTDVACTRYQRLAELIIECNPMDSYNQTRAALRAGEPDEVIQAFERLLRRQENIIEILLEFGVYLLSLGRDGDAADRLSEAWEKLQEQVADQRTSGRSPYRQETALQLGRARLAAARKALDRIREQIHSHRERYQEELEKIHADLSAVLERAEKLLVSGQQGVTPFWIQRGQTAALLAQTEELLLISAQSKELMLSIPKKEPLPISNDDIRQRLEFAVEAYEEAIAQSPTDYRTLHELSRAKWHLAVYQEEKTAYTKAIEQYAKIVNLRSDYPDALRDWGSGLLSLAVAGDSRPMPFLTVYYPYVDWKGEKNDWPAGGRIEFSPNGPEQLAEAREKLQRCLQQRPEMYLAHAYLGLVSLMEALLLPEGDRQRIDCFTNATESFGRATLYQPFFTPAYFYSGLSQLLLWAEETDRDSNDTIRQIRFRQAFYRLEHYIDQEIEHLLDKVSGPDSRYSDGIKKTILDNKSAVEGEERAPFYFDPEDIDGIKKTPFAFARLLERELRLLPLTESLHRATDLKPNIAEEFLGAIAKHLRV
uniref:CobQ/CobB/MinD/ParA nucleotide binding domain-containing protein n=1 Tax=Candidatus Kentrum sp. DK TaxID=2126562 RepID=A0A450SXQ6_9GAMM|nr:MAG: CobQ/CobB/MinD/ParA nucleotide binding domain-containing protein [Candidatus Kentron sp. DK]